MIFFCTCHLFCLLEPPSIIPFSFGSEEVNEGDMAQLACFVSRGDEPLRISWSLKGDIISSEPTMTTTMIGTRTSMLMISRVGYRHSGTYTCTATNKAGSVFHSAELLVKGRGRLGGKGREAKSGGTLQSFRIHNLFIFQLILQNHLKLHPFHLLLIPWMKEALRKLDAP